MGGSREVAKTLKFTSMAVSQARRMTAARTAPSGATATQLSLQLLEFEQRADVKPFSKNLEEVSNFDQ
jgi:hypothetical protein